MTGLPLGDALSAILQEDDAARELALDPHRSIALQAPAGSGKTTVLTQRILALLAVVDEPEAILAVTFTRKAAAEMRSRVLGALRRAAESSEAPPPPKVTSKRDAKAVTLALAKAAWQRSLERDWRLLENPARLRIQTIDGLNHRLAAAMPISARGVAELQLADALIPLYREAARRCLLDAEADPTHAKDSQRIFLRVNNDWRRLESLIATMLSRRASWQRGLLSHGPDGLKDQITATLRAARKLAVEAVHQVIGLDLLEEGLALVRHVNEVLYRGPLERVDAHSFASLRAVAELALVKSKDLALRRKVNKNDGFPSDQKAMKQRVLDWLQALQELEATRGPEFLETLDELRLLPTDAEIREDLQAFAALSELLRLALAELQVLFTERGLVDHTAVANTAVNALETGALEDWAQLNNERLQHILIDEFQDTSADQLRLLAALTQDWQPNEDRSLFLVGDPMQSIYQFRDADVGLFSITQRRGVGAMSLQPLRLMRNFRSRPSIVAFINTSFAQIFPREDHALLAAARYVPCVAGHSEGDPADGPDGVTCHAVVGVGEDGVNAEATRVVHIVRETWSLDRAASIAVLVSSRRHAGPLVAALQEAGFPVQGVDLVALADTPVVLDLIALTRALHDLTDRIAWLALLRSPACGLTLETLTRWMPSFETPMTIADALRSAINEFGAEADCQGEHIAFLSQDERERIARLWQAIVPELSSREPLAQRVERCWLRLRGPWCYPSSSAPTDARRYLDTLAIHEASGRWRGVEDFDWMLDGLYAAPQASVISAQQTVQVMTVHRAKGLEFDCVILPGLARVPRGDESDLLNALRWIDDQGQEAWIMAPIRAAHESSDQNLLRWIKRKRYQRALNERTRVWYVAATRAKRWLHWVAQRESFDTAPRKGTPLATLWPALAQAFQQSERDSALSQPEALTHSPTFTDADALTIRDGQAQPERHLARLPLRLPAIALAPAVHAAIVPVAETSPIDLRWVWVGSAARRAGTVVHRELERLAHQKILPTDVDEFLVAHASRWRAALHREGVAVNELTAMGQRVSLAIGRCLRDSQGRWLLSDHGPENEVELPLTGWVAGELVTGVLDRCFIDGGCRWVVDYKTTTHEGGDLELFLAEQARRYTPQMRRYVELVKPLGPQPVRAGLYFPWLQKFIELSLD